MYSSVTGYKQPHRVCANDTRSVHQGGVAAVISECTCVADNTPRGSMAVRGDGGRRVARGGGGGGWGVGGPCSQNST